MIPAVMYNRMSSDRQETSIATQRVKVAAYAEKHGYQLVQEYKDVGTSGGQKEKRSSL
jgi:DNA invertase Pin-like site-specific DNA recombinase